MEHIVSFVPGQLPHEDRFQVLMAGITYPDRSYRITREHSDLYCIEYVLAGMGEVRCAGQHFFPRAGDVYLLPPGVRHDYRAMPSNPYRKIWMNVNGTLCDCLYREYALEGTWLFPGNGGVNANGRPLFASFLSTGENDRSNPVVLSRRLSLTLHEILSTLSAIPERFSPSAQQPYATAIREYLDLHVEGNIRLGKAAHDLGMSLSQLSRSFTRAYAQTPYRYYLSQRIALACSLLRNTGMRISDIAARLHYADEHYFSTQFRRHTGLPPKEFRRSSEPTHTLMPAPASQGHSEDGQSTRG